MQDSSIIIAAFQAAGWRIVESGNPVVASSPWGDTRYVIEAESLACEEVESLLARLPVDSAGNPRRIIVVSGREPELHPLLERHPAATHATPKEFVDWLFGVDQYLEKLRSFVGEYLRDRTNILLPLGHYTSLKAMVWNPNGGEAQVTLDSDLAKKLYGRFVCVVLGAAGAGKTTAAFTALGKALADDAGHALLPIIVLAKEVNRAPSRDILDSAGISLLARPLTERAFEILGQFHKLVYVVDGLDEFRLHGTSDDLEATLHTILKRVPAAECVLITCRLEAYTRPRDARGSYSGAREIIAKTVRAFHKAPLYFFEPQPLSREQATEIVAKDLNEAVARELIGLMEDRYAQFYSHPLLLRATVEQYRKDPAALMEPLSAWPGNLSAVFVKLYVEWWLEREWLEKLRTRTDSIQKHRFLEEIARLNFMKGEDAVDPRDFEVVAKRLHPLTDQRPESLAAEASLSGLIYYFAVGGAGAHAASYYGVGRQHNRLHFAAELFYNYFLAAAIAREFTEALTALEHDPASVDFVFSILGKASLSEQTVPLGLICSYLEEVANHQSLTDGLQKLLLLTRELRFRHFPPHRYLGANLFGLLVEAERRAATAKGCALQREVELAELGIAGVDLSHFRLEPGVELRLRDCDLRLVTFSGADLDRVVIEGGDCRRSSWAHAKLRRTPFGVPEPKLDESIGWEDTPIVRDGAESTASILKRYCPPGMAGIWIEEPIELAVQVASGWQSKYVRISPYFIETQAKRPGELGGYLTRAGKLDYLAARHFAASEGRRLPTAAEWELAARIACGEVAMKGVSAELQFPGESSEWVLDEKDEKVEVEDTHASSELDPCNEGAEYPAIGTLGVPDWYLDTQPRRSRFLAGSDPPGSPRAVPESDAGGDASVRCVVDWPFVDGSGQTVLSTATILERWDGDIQD